MAEDTRYSVNTGMVTISTSNVRRDGTGTMGDVITGASNGTVIKSVIIKAQTNTTEGMVRLFIYNGVSNPFLLAEIPVPNITKSARDKSFEANLDLDLFLQPGDVLKASTENAETFNVIALGLDISYSTTAIFDRTMYKAQNGFDTISVANSNLNGTGTIVVIMITDNTYLGAEIQRFFVKAISTTTPGMVRLYIQNSAGSSTMLFTEIEVSAITPTATATSFGHVINCSNFFLQAGYKLVASTEKAETFVVSIEAFDFKYS